MILAIPVSKADVHLLPKKVELLKKLGPYPNHILAMLPDEPVKQPAHVAFSQLTPLFQGSHFLPVDLAGLSGWPIASNRHFKYVARKIMGLNLKEAFYFFELDNTPMVTGWLDRLQNEYIDANKPHMGHVCPTRGYLHQPDGSVIPQEGEPHMVGTGIYPPNLAAYSVKLPAIDRPSPWTRMPLEPFDVAMRHEIVPTAHATKLIQHNWQTRNYREENGQIVCDDSDGIGPNESHKKPWDQVSIVIHGCKDDSLPNLVLKGLSQTNSTKGKVASATGIAEGTYAPTVADVSPSDETSKPHPTFIGAKILKLLSEKSHKVNDLSKALDLTAEQIKAEVANPVNGLVLAGKAGWVKKA